MQEVKENIIDQKLRGGYYTPKAIAEFLCRWSINVDTKSILEPSCGDGNFVESAILRFKELGIEGESLKGRIKGIELIENESMKAKQRAAKLGLNSDTIVNSDFFCYIKNSNSKKYDVVIGNPPFIRYQNFPEEHRALAIEMMQDLGLNPNKLTNIWVPFLVVSASLLKENGKMAMVIPAELFQVKYAAETRVFLSKFFQRITIVTFKKLVFQDIQQEVVLLLCEKKVDHGKGIRVIECENIKDLDSLNFEEINGSKVKPVDHSTEKWTKYFLNEDEINLLKRLKNDKRIISCSDIMKVEVGLVTGRNEFFMLNEKQVNEWRLKEFTIPVVSRSNQLKGITFSEDDFLFNSEAQNSIYLFMPPNEDFEVLPKVCQEYIKYGEEQGFHTGYKTRIRKRWYITPSLWVPDAFALRQVGDYPKIIMNRTGASSTDTIHRVKFKENIDSNIVTASFLNSLTFAFSEITGRSYGGGVLTFEPTEIQEIKIPIVGDINIDFLKLDSLIRERKIDDALNMVDEELLIRYHGFEEDELKTLRSIWKKMASRRTNRK
ncbi:class I SAM-dependent methyltransferase [uncultured Chryseobacterium sp.]|uniref:class I SAM-dependent methyltransferase n=1 Tax=uncultured Chryseobacterium sp. TaxID=259322 RepID=UPI0025EFCEF5|nr:class I SAM-dependent methyltransferase [uncultured Chryseobacterium sp.]